MSSLYSTQLTDGLPEGVPAPVSAAARESLGAAVQVGAAVADPAREAFVHAMSRASILAALVAVLGAFIAWRHLPAREGAPDDGSPAADGGLAPARRAAQPAVRPRGRVEPNGGAVQGDVDRVIRFGADARG